MAQGSGENRNRLRNSRLRQQADRAIDLDNQGDVNQLKVRSDTTKQYDEDMVRKLQWIRDVSVSLETFLDSRRPRLIYLGM